MELGLLSIMEYKPMFSTCTFMLRLLNVFNVVFALEEATGKIEYLMGQKALLQVNNRKRLK
jgi:hypothetical protein